MVGSRVRRAECTVWRRLLEAALVPRCGQSVYITCSRWRRFPAARARSLTRLAAFLRRQAPSSMVRAPTVTSKPPSTLMRTASGFLPVSLLGLCEGLRCCWWCCSAAACRCVCPFILSPYICLKGKPTIRCSHGIRLARWLLTPYLCPTFFYGTWLKASTRFYEHTLY